jgi:hypothetical protein
MKQVFEKNSQNVKLLEKRSIYTIQTNQIMQYGSFISHLGLSAREPMAFCVYSDRGTQDINKWTIPGPESER